SITKIKAREILD
nr:RecName: Full=Beta-enolase; AltName: Full=2-phospho-D-glycerate hydro-lyase; AltName: Full=Enolase 3; AltName: Full=Muscle-specific enolase; Short=MSE; AltName: Full=Skeletal muscle enolase [Thunnus albacares]